MVSPPLKENVGPSSGSTPTLPYFHGQANFPSLTLSSSFIPTPSLSIPISQNVTRRHFPLSSLSTSFPHHASFQPSLTSLSDPPPYPRSILPSSLDSTLQGNLLSSVYPQPTPLLDSNLPAGSSLSFHQPTLFSQSSLNLWPSHSIYHPQPIYTIGHPFSSLSSSSLSTFSTNTFTTSSNTIPFFTTIPVSPDQVPVVPQNGDPPEVGREAGEDVTSITILKPLLLIPLLLLIWIFLLKSFLVWFLQVSLS